MYQVICQRLLAIMVLLLLSGCNTVDNNTNPPTEQQFTLALDPEELRQPRAVVQYPKMALRYQSQVSTQARQLQLVTSQTEAKQLIKDFGGELWRLSKADITARQDGDDRALYWARLAMQVAIKQRAFNFTVEHKTREELLNVWELSSRGMLDINFSPNPNIHRILITGFDPFLLDRHLNQSNPSGVAAMLLDGKLIEINGVESIVEAVMIPVRFTDFDQGLIETLLTPWMDSDTRLDMLATISMGRSDFDLERFPGKRRSATIGGNRNVITGANTSHPMVPLLYNSPHPGAEFVEFSLPASLMQQATGPFAINDNRNVITLNTGKLTALSLTQLSQEISVEGSGGGYLSNEISYRSIALRDKLHPSLAVGHIHTPRIEAFEPAKSIMITAQIEAMLKQASSQFNP